MVIYIVYKRIISYRLVFLEGYYEETKSTIKKKSANSQETFAEYINIIRVRKSLIVCTFALSSCGKF